MTNTTETFSTELKTSQINTTETFFTELKKEGDGSQERIETPTTTDETTTQINTTTEPATENSNTLAQDERKETEIGNEIATINNDWVDQIRNEFEKMQRLGKKHNKKNFCQ